MVTFASIVAFILSVSLATFWGMLAVLLFIIVIVLGAFRSVRAGSLLLLMVAALLYVRFEPSIEVMTGIFFAWFIIGILYARLRWKLQFTKLKNRVVEAWVEFQSKRPQVLKNREERQQRHAEEIKRTNNDRHSTENEDLFLSRTSWETNQVRIQKEEDTLSVDVQNCDLDQNPSVIVEEGDDTSKILKKFRPLFSKYRGTIAAWAVVWPLYLLQDLTIDLVRNALELLHGNFQRAADQAFS